MQKQKLRNCENVTIFGINVVVIVLWCVCVCAVLNVQYLNQFIEILLSVTDQHFFQIILNVVVHKGLHRWLFAMQASSFVTKLGADYQSNWSYNFTVHFSYE